MLVSVIIRTIGRNLIFRAIKSLENQTFKGFEVVIIEDGSHTLENQNLSNTLTIRYYSIDNKIGRSAAGNFGMEMASGKYLIFLDDDDEFLPNHLEILVNKAKEFPESMVAGLALEIGQSECNNYTTKPYKLYKKRIKSLIHKKNFLPINAVLFSKTLYNRYGGFENDLNALEDWVLWAKYLYYSDLQYTNSYSAVYYVPFSLHQYLRRRKIIKNHYHDALEKVNSIWGGECDNTANTVYFVKFRNFFDKALMLSKVIWYRVLVYIKHLLKVFHGKN